MLQSRAKSRKILLFAFYLKFLAAGGEYNSEKGAWNSGISPYS